MPVLQRGSSIKVGDMDFTSSWFFPSSFAPLGRSSYPGTEEAQDLAAFLFGSNSIFSSQSSKTIKFQGEEIWSGELDKHASNAQHNKFNTQSAKHSIHSMEKHNKFTSIKSIKETE